jgi:hypothetical protein
MCGRRRRHPRSSRAGVAAKYPNTPRHPMMVRRRLPLFRHSLVAAGEVRDDAESLRANQPWLPALSCYLGRCLDVLPCPGLSCPCVMPRILRCVALPCRCVAVNCWIDLFRIKARLRRAGALRAALRAVLERHGPATRSDFFRCVTCNLRPLVQATPRPALGRHRHHQCPHLRSQDQR